MNAFKSGNTSLENFDGISFVEKHFDIYIPYLVICSIGIVLGIAGEYPNISVH